MAEFKDGSYVIKDGTIYKVNIDLDRIFGADVISIPFFLKKTNADRIRSMSDEELAEMLCSGTCKYCHSYNKDCDILDWLKKEAEDG